MCIVSESHIRKALNGAAQRAIQQLNDVAAYTTTAQQLQALLHTATPLVVPAPEPMPEQLTAATLMRHRFIDYPLVLQECIGPPLRIGREPLLGYVSAQCALSALRHNDTQAALSALFLTSLSASHLQRPALEALHHLLLETDVHGSPGLLLLPAWRTETSPADLSAIRHRLKLSLVATAVQINSTLSTGDDDDLIAKGPRCESEEHTAQPDDTNASANTRRGPLPGSPDLYGSDSGARRPDAS